MAPYFPPRSLSRPFKTIVLQHDPDHEHAKRNEIEYEFSNGRVFKANPAVRGPYAPEE